MQLVYENSSLTFLFISYRNLNFNDSLSEDDFRVIFRVENNHEEVLYGNIKHF